MHNDNGLVNKNTNHNPSSNLMIVDEGSLPDDHATSLLFDEKNKDPRLAEMQTAIHGSNEMQKAL
jgi:hypothetical protein